MRRTFFVAVGILLLAAPSPAQETGLERQERLIQEMLTRPATPLYTGEEQEEIEPIETDRDSFTPATTLVIPNRWIIESAYSFIDNRTVRDTHSYPEMLLRLGIFGEAEVRLGYNYEVGGAGNDASSSGGGDEFDSPGLEREHTFSYGIKGRLSEQQAWRPRSVVILHGSTPSGGENSDSSFVATYAAGWDLAGGWLWDNALRFKTASEGNDHFHIWAPSTVFKVPVGEKWTTHIEYFGVFTDQKADNSVKHFLSPGVHYLITPDLEVGIRAGWGLNHDAANFFANAGFGWQY